MFDSGGYMLLVHLLLVCGFPRWVGFGCWIWWVVGVLRPMWLVLICFALVGVVLSLCFAVLFA